LVEADGARARALVAGEEDTEELVDFLLTGEGLGVE
jgi:hypothetical protein